MKVGIIGLGNIGLSLIQGFSKVEGVHLYAFDKNSDKNLKGNEASSSNSFIEKDVESVIDKSETILLCIRSVQVLEWLRSYSNLLNTKTLILMQSGLALSEINSSLGNVQVMRAITNINVSCKLGHTILLKSKSNEFAKVANLFGQLGKVILTDSEDKLDRLSLVTGCTPAISGLFMKGLYESENDLLQTDNNILNLINEVVLNSIKVLGNQKHSPDAYIRSVCTKGGLLEQCVEHLKNDKEFINSIRRWIDPMKAHSGTKIDE